MEPRRKCTNDADLRIIELPFEQLAVDLEHRRGAGVTSAGAGNNVAELVRQGVAEELATYPKLIRFPGTVEALRVG